MRSVVVAVASSLVTAVVVVGVGLRGQAFDDHRSVDVNLMVRNHPLELNDKGDRLKVDVEGRVKQDSIVMAFEPQLSTGVTPPILTNGVSSHTAQLVVSGQPQACAYRLEGSNDGGNHWFPLNDQDTPCLASTAIFAPERPVQMVHGVLVAMSGGTAGSVAMYYAGR